MQQQSQEKITERKTCAFRRVLVDSAAMPPLLEADILPAMRSRAVIDLMVTAEEIRRGNLIDSLNEAGPIQCNDLTGEIVTCGIGLWPIVGR